MKLGKKLCVFFVGNLLLRVVCNGISNMMDGKTFFGGKKKTKERADTYADWKGNIHLGTDDFQVN